MEIFASDARTVTLDNFSIERHAVGAPVTVRAQLLVSTPTMRPAEMRIQAECEFDDIPNPNQRDLGRRLLELISMRVA
jgi:hypothetical protein